MLIYLMMIDSEKEQSKFEIIYKTYQRAMFYIAYKILHNEQDAEDAVHQAFIKIVENINKIEEAVCPKTKGYVVTIVENKAIDIYRKKQKLQLLELNETITGIEVEYHGEGALTKCILNLPLNYRELILLKYLHGYSTKEIAKIMGISNSNASKLDQRAKKKLEDLCKKEGLI